MDELRRSKGIPRNKLVIVGAGRVGQTLGRLLSDRGYVLLAVLNRSVSRVTAARRFTKAQRGFVGLPAEVFKQADIIFLTTPDGAIAPTAKSLAALELSWRGKTVFHTSGALSSSELSSLRKRGAAIASLHPLQTFPSPRDGIRKAKSIYYTFEGDRAAAPVARQLVRDLEGRMVSIPARFKPLYHCAGTFACGGLLAPLSVAYTLYQRIGLDEKAARAMLKPMVEATLETGQSHSLPEALTGPLSRGDVRTITAHLAALEKFAPHFLSFYKQLSLRLLELATPKIGPARAQVMRSLLTRKSRR